jgi:hypothetical protein
MWPPLSWAVYYATSYLAKAIQERDQIGGIYPILAYSVMLLLAAMGLIAYIGDAVRL